MFSKLKTPDSHETCCIGLVRFDAIIIGILDSFRRVALSGDNLGINLLNEDPISDANNPRRFIESPSKPSKKVGRVP